MVEDELQKKEAGTSSSPNQVDLNGTPGMIRTCDPLIRSQVLYPAELRVLKNECLDYKANPRVSSFRHFEKGF